MVVTLVARNLSEAMVVPMVGSGVYYVLRILESDGQFCVVAFGVNMSSIVVNTF